MKTKLTLSIDEDLVQFAHEEAKQRNRSISALFSEYLVGRKRRAGKSKRYLIDEMVGSLKGYHIDDSKEGIRQAYADKYLRRH